MRPTHDPLPVDSSPRGATVLCRGAAVGVTPCTVSMPNGVYELTLRLDGHHDRLVLPGTTGRGGLILLSLLMWGPVGVIFDAVTGASTMVDTMPVHVELEPASKEPLPAWERRVHDTRFRDDAWAPIQGHRP